MSGPRGLAMMRALLAIAALAAALEVGAQGMPTADQYREVHPGDLVGGYVKPRQKIETTGFLGAFGGKLFLKVNLPSAQWPLPIDVGRLTEEAVRNVESRCRAENDPLTIGGCTARIRGEVLTLSLGDRRPNLVADAIEVLGPPR